MSPCLLALQRFKPQQVPGILGGSSSSPSRISPNRGFVEIYAGFSQMVSSKVACVFGGRAWRGVAQSVFR